MSFTAFSGISSVSPEIITEASKYTLNEFYFSHLAERRSFFKKLQPEQIMTWSNNLISKPLLKIPTQLHDTGVQIFKNLMSYMGDRKSTKKPTGHLKKHLKLTLNAPEDLKDEAYVQVLKQIKDHKDYDKAMRGWNFLALLASSYAPSEELYYSILNYLIYEAKNSHDENIVKRSNYIFVRMTRSFEQKRKQIPSDEEITHVEAMKPLMFPVYFFSESHTMVQSESYTTVRELKTVIMRKLQLSVSRIPYYALYEVCTKQDVVEERFLDDHDKVVDITAVWARESEDYSKKNQTIQFKIYLKIQLFYGYNEHDIDTITMHYVQTAYDVSIGKFKLEEEDIVKLGAIQLKANYGNLDHEEILKLLEKNIERYVPGNKFKQTQASYWVKKIMEVYTELNIDSKNEAKLTYLEHLKDNPMWEAHQFFVKYSKTYNTTNPENFPEDLVIGIKPNGIIICDTDRNELYLITYANIASWGVNNSLFVVVIQKSETELVKHYFESNQVN